MKTTMFLGLLALALASCTKTRCGDVTVQDADHLGQGGEGGDAGDGGAGGGAGDGGGAAAEVCLPGDVFVGSDGCYYPTPICCPTEIDLDAHCAQASDGDLPVPYLCSTVPVLGFPSAVDNRKCIEIISSAIDCQWGTSTLICCDLP